ncbi:MAG: APC family permease [Candidatus Nanopelagicales bacterium]
MPLLKRALLGTPISNERAVHNLLPKWIALPVFCSDPLSSVAYATQEILLVLVLGGLSALAWTPWVGLAVSALLVIVVLSYQKTVHAYPDGGGAYAVTKENFGQRTALVAASALIVDYILTVAVSVTAGVDNIVSAIPSASPYVVEICVGIVVVLTVMNLRGVKESGKSFAAPTYFFIATVLLMFVVAIVRALTGSPVRAESADLPVHGAGTAGIAAVLLLLRAFASGCTALTGVEAVSNGVPFFRLPKSKNAAMTLAVMGSLAVVMFGGVTALAVTSGVRIAENPLDLGLPADAVQQTVIAQLGSATFGASSVGFYALQFFTMAVLVLAANTAYNSFPILAAVLGRDGYMPRQFGRRGDRLVFSNGIIVLATLAIVLIIAFDASVTRLIQLYILGVFLSFTLSQAGMVRHWSRLLRNPATAGRGAIQRARALNAVGAVVTSVVLVIVVATKFTHGAWMVILAVPVFFLLMVAINRHYRRMDRWLRAAPGGFTLPSRVHGIVLVSRLHAPAIQALAYARATRPSTLVAVHVQTDRSDVEALQREWLEREIPVPLVILESPYRDITGAFIEYVRRIRRESPRDLVGVFIPEYVVMHPWEALLHNQSALRLRVRLRLERGVVVTSVPLQLRDYAIEAYSPDVVDLHH